MTPIDIFMFVPFALLIAILVYTLGFLAWLCYKDGHLSGMYVFIVVTWFLLSLVYFAVKPAHSAEATLPMSATIINLTDVPLEEAIAFCDERNLICPELRSQWDEITKVQFDYALDQINDGYALDRIEPASGSEVYE